MKQLHQTYSSHGCGAAALRCMFGGTTLGWRRKILAHRRKHGVSRYNNFRAGELNESYMRDWTFDTEMRHLMSEKLGKKVRFTKLKKRRRLRNFSLPAGTFLVALESHYIIMQDNLIFDSGAWGSAASEYRYNQDLVEAHYRLPDYNSPIIRIDEPPPAREYFSNWTITWSNCDTSCS